MRLLDEYRLEKDRTAKAGSTAPITPEPLRMVLTGTAGTGKSVVNNEMMRRIGGERLKLMAPTGNAACGLRGQVSSFLLLLAFIWDFPTLFSLSWTFERLMTGLQNIPSPPVPFAYSCADYP